MRYSNEVKNPLVRRGVRAQLIALLLALTLMATALTGWMIYERAAAQLIADAWTQNEALLQTACASLYRELEQVRSFSWQLSSSDKVISLLYTKRMSPENILVKRDLIDLLLNMKAFSDTLCDIGVYFSASETVVTAETSYDAPDYYARISGFTGREIDAARARAKTAVLCDYAGAYDMERIISKDRALIFLTDLPVGRGSALGYALFCMRADRLSALLPVSGSGALLITDMAGEPLACSGSDEYIALCRGLGNCPSGRVTAQGREYGVLASEVGGLRCVAIVPYADMLARADTMRGMVMAIMGVCMALCLMASVFISRKLYAPLDGLMRMLEQLGHALPEKGARNEFALLGDALRLTSEQNSALRLTNSQINRMLKNQLLSELMEGRLPERGMRALRQADVPLAYAFAQVAAVELEQDAHGLMRINESLKADVADWVEQQLKLNDYGALECWCAQREDGRLLMLFNIDAKHPHPEVIYDYINRCHDTLSALSPCRVGVGRAYRLSLASSSLVDAMVALHAGGADGVRLAEESEAPPDTEYSLEAETRLINQALSGRKEDVAETLRELTDAAVTRGSLTEALLFTARRVARQADVEDAYLHGVSSEGLRTRELPDDDHAAERVRNVFFAVMDGICNMRGTQDERLYARLLDYIAAEYKNDISLDTASDALGLSPSYIGLIFRRAGGASFTRTVNEARVNEAKRLLAETELTVREIGERVGVENQNTFIRVFKKAEGVTPGQYRMAKTGIDSPN